MRIAPVTTWTVQFRKDLWRSRVAGRLFDACLAVLKLVAGPWETKRETGNEEVPD